MTDTPVWKSTNVDKNQMFVRDLGIFGGVILVGVILLAFILKFCCMVLSWLCFLN